MSVPLVIFLAVAVISLLTISVLAIGLLGRLRELKAAVTEVQGELRPMLDDLRRKSEVTQRELARVSKATGSLRRQVQLAPTRDELVAGTASVLGPSGDRSATSRPQPGRR